MIIYLNHELIECENHKNNYDFYIKKAIDDIIYYCQNCNIKVYFTIESRYWQYVGKKWEILKLTCEEEQIKNLLE